MAILTPTKNTRAEDFDTLEGFWSSLGLGGRPDVAGGARPGVGRDEPPAARWRRPPWPPSCRRRYFRLCRHRACWTPRGSPRATRSCGSRSSCSTARTSWRRWSNTRAQLAALRTAVQQGDQADLRSAPRTGQEEPRCSGKLTSIPSEGQPDLAARRVAADAADLGLAADLAVDRRPGYLIQGDLDRQQVAPDRRRAAGRPRGRADGGCPGGRRGARPAARRPARG